jgi:hypothetical protein
MVLVLSKAIALTRAMASMYFPPFTSPFAEAMRHKLQLELRLQAHRDRQSLTV